MSSVDRVDGDLDIDVGSLFAALWRRKLPILLLSLIFTALAAVAVLMVSPKYKAETRVLIAPGESVYTRPDTGSIDESRPIIEPEGVMSQVELMSSSDILGKVADDLKLAEHSEFDPNSASLSDKIMALAGRAPELGLKDSVIAKMRERLQIFRVENSRVIVISFSSKEPQLAAKVPEAIAAAYLETQQKTKLSTDTTATDWLEGEIRDLTEKVKVSEGKVASYRSQNDILDGQNNAALATQQLAELSSELTRVRAARANAEAKSQSVRALIESGASVETVPEILASGLMQRLREQQVNLKSQIADLSITLLDNHPRLKGLRSQLSDLNGQIRSEASKVLASLETEARTAALREKELQASLNGLKAESARVGNDEVGLRALEREAAANRDILESYLTRYREAASRKDRNYQVPDARVFAKAEVPSEAYFPKVIPTISAAFAGSIIILSVITLLSELFSGAAFRARAAAPAPVPVRPAEPVAAAGEATEEPKAAPAPAAATVIAAPEPQIDDELTIRAVAARLIGEGHTCAVIVSPEGDVASASSVLLARELADQGLKAVLLDLTRSSSAAGPMTDNIALPGITNLLAGSATFANIIHNDVYSEAHVIPTGNADPAQAAKAVERLPIIINALVSAYDIVVVECGPSTASSIRRLVTPGATLLVSIVNPDSKVALAAMTDLISAGYDDLILVSPAGAVGQNPVGGRNAA